MLVWKRMMMMMMKEEEDSHLQQPSGPALVSWLLSVSVDMDETSFEEDEDVEGSWESLLTAAPVLWETDPMFIRQVLRKQRLSHFKM